MSLFAQHGYGKSDKIDRGILAGDIAGVILSPKSESPDTMMRITESFSDYPEEVKVYFDPQFYICGLQGEANAGKLIQYPYYAGQLTRANLSAPINLHNYSKSVIDYQKSINITDIFSPTIIFDDFNGRESQTAISLAYESIDMTNSADQLYISLCINESAFLHKEAMEDFLNVISLLDVKGFYIIIERLSSSDKSTAINANALSNIMNFVYTLSELNNFDVIMGYSDLISVLLAAVGKANFACGWYNSLKMFSESNFRPSTGGRHPNKRYTSGVLLSSILLVPELATLSRAGITNLIISQSRYNGIVYPLLHDTAWTDEISCLHNWHVISNLLKEIDQLPTVGEKLDLVTKKVTKASSIYRLINAKIPFLDAKSNNSHLDIWLEAIRNFRAQVGV